MVDFLESNLFNPSAPQEFMISSERHFHKLSFDVSNEFQSDDEDEDSLTMMWSSLLNKFKRFHVQINAYQSLDGETFNEKGDSNHCLKTTIKEKLFCQKRILLSTLQKLSIRKDILELHKLRCGVNVRPFFDDIRNYFSSEVNSEKILLLEGDEIPTNSKTESKKTNVKRFLNRKKIISSNLIATAKRVSNSRRKAAQKRIIKSCQNWAFGVASMTAFPPQISLSETLASERNKFDFSFISTSTDGTKIFY
ncbi:UNVERIFIED_CONTAM: hypothetical protein RMT77_006294 [Armadillidium vulgare]